MTRALGDDVDQHDIAVRAARHERRCEGAPPQRLHRGPVVVVGLGRVRVAPPHAHQTGRARGRDGSVDRRRDGHDLAARPVERRRAHQVGFVAASQRARAFAGLHAPADDVAAGAADHFFGVRQGGDGRARRGDDAREPLRRVAEVVLLHWSCCCGSTLAV